MDGREVPDANEEYLIYQTLLGLWPANPSELPSVCTRLQSYIVKAIREAKIHTRWADPNQAHESAVSGFIESILDRQNHPKFLCSVARLQEQIGYAGMINALGETLLKIACPGVPDFYQGSEFWDIHLVDPDNRNPIDFPIRIQALQDLMDRAAANPAAIASELLAAWPDGRLKMYVIWRALGYRRQHSVLFTEGEFIPLEVVGQQSEHVIAYLRRQGKVQVIAIIPRWVAKIPASSDAAATTDFWRGTNLLLPAGSPIAWSNVFTVSSTEAKGGAGKLWIAVGDLLKDFPITLLAANS
jgi:(1->4)-alpha-D-glucan 1-alpha-D-glucosylmutase